MSKFGVLIEIENKNIQEEPDKELIRMIVEQLVKTYMPQQDIKSVKIVTVV